MTTTTWSQLAALCPCIESYLLGRLRRIFIPEEETKRRWCAAAVEPSAHPAGIASPVRQSADALPVPGALPDGGIQRSAERSLLLSSRAEGLLLEVVSRAAVTMAGALRAASALQLLLCAGLARVAAAALQSTHLASTTGVTAQLPARGDYVCPFDCGGSASLCATGAKFASELRVTHPQVLCRIVWTACLPRRKACS